MTVSYTEHVATSKGIPSGFVKLLKRWRGSIYKLIYFDLLIFLGLYYTINFIYRFALDEEEKKTFRGVVSYFAAYNSRIPISFFLGFYVSIVVTRWASQIFSVPWPHPTAVFVSSHLRGNDERGRKMRRTVMRYICLCQIMVFMLISPKVRKRFPTYDKLVEAGVLNENEKKIIMAMDEVYPKRHKYWMPIVWASSIFTRARKEGRIRDDFALRTLNDSIDSFRQYCITLLHYDTISVPLVYTQVVSLAVYAYFGASIIGNQWVGHKEKVDLIYTVSYVFPLFTTLEFFFFMGWLKVAETLLCPFGDDDDDIDVNQMIDSNIKISYIIVDEMHNRHPQLMKDQYWDEVYPYELPGGGSEPPKHSTAHIDYKYTSEHPSGVQVQVKRSDSRTPFHWKRSSDDTETIPLVQDYTSDSDKTEDEVPKQVQSTIFHSMSTGLGASEFEEEEEEEEEQGEASDNEYTFEKLREERERERIERRQQKVQRTVESIAEMTADLPRKTPKGPFTTLSDDKHTEESADESTNTTDKNIQDKKGADESEEKSDDQKDQDERDEERR